MGIDNIPTRSTGQTILDDFFNVLKRVCSGDWVPRNVSGVPAANAGNLGTETYPWARANVSTGFFVCGDVKMFHDYNGAISPGHGWMKCNGDLVNETNYDAIHGAGSWDTYIVGSPIEGKYLPNMNNKFPVGATNTAETGVGAVASEGNASHQVNLAHTHTGPSHNHIWHTLNGSDNSASYNSGGSSVAIASDTQNGDSRLAYNTGGQGPDLVRTTYYTNNGGTGNTGSSLSSTQNIKPESIAFEFWMRII